MSPSRLTWRTWVVAGVLAAVLFGTVYYRDHLSPHARAREVAAGFWQAAVAGDEASVARLLAPESSQTAARLVMFFRGYTRAGEPGSLTVNDAAGAYRAYGLNYEVVSGAVGPDGYNRSYVVGLTRLSSGDLAVLFVGSGYSAGPKGPIVPVLQSYGGLDPGKVFTFYDNGTYRQATLSEIADMVKVAASDAKAQLGPDWFRRPGFAARYFTLDLVGINDWRRDVWSQTASGPGNVILGGGGESLGIYIGQHDPDDVRDTATVTLKTAKKTAFLIGLARPWSGGPWLVVSVNPTKYVEGP